MILTSTRHVVREHRDLRVLERAKEIVDAMVDLRLADADRVKDARVDRVRQRRSARAETERPARPASASSRAARPGMHATNFPSRANAMKPGAVPFGLSGGTAAARKLRLLAVVRAHRPSDLAKNVFHLRAAPARSSSTFEAERVADGLLRQIVDRRPETAGRDRRRRRGRARREHRAAIRSRLSPTACVARHVDRRAPPALAR